MSDAAQSIDQRISEYPDWRGETLARVREIVLSSAPDIVEEWKLNVPVWSCAGILCTGEVYAKAVKMTFAHGASLADPQRLFTSSLEGKVRRALDMREGEEVNAPALTELVRAAREFNLARQK